MNLNFNQTHHMVLDSDVPYRRHSSLEAKYAHSSKNVMYQLVRDKTAELRRLVEGFVTDETVNSTEHNVIQTEVLQILNILHASTYVPTTAFTSPLSTSWNTNQTTVANNNTSNTRNSVSQVVTDTSSNLPTSNDNSMDYTPMRSVGSFVNFQSNYSYRTLPQSVNDRESIEAKRCVAEKPKSDLSAANNVRVLIQLPPVNTLLMKENDINNSHQHYPLSQPANMYHQNQQHFPIQHHDSVSQESSQFQPLQDRHYHQTGTTPVPPMMVTTNDAAGPVIPSTANASQIQEEQDGSVVNDKDDHSSGSTTERETTLRISKTELDGSITNAMPINDSSLPLKKNQCHICGRICSRPSTLQTHLSIHTGDKPYKCPKRNCHKRFNVKSNMLRHYKRHEFKSAAAATAAGQRQHQTAPRTNEANFVNA